MGERDPPDLLTGIIKGINPRVHQEDIIGSLTGSRISSKHGSIILEKLSNNTHLIHFSLSGPSQLMCLSTDRHVIP